MSDAARPQAARGGRGVVRRDDCRHANAHIKDLIHLFLGYASALLQDFENGRDFPALSLNYRVAIVGQNAREIVNHSAAGDVGEAFQLSVGHFRQERLVVFVRAEKLFAERQAQPGQARRRFQAQLLEKYFAREGVAVGVQAVGRQADE